MKVLGRFDHLTFKGNLRDTRYGWLRLTPAYSVHLVSEIIDRSLDAVVLDPFCGTGTTALVCAERGIASDTTDINPFLLWLTATKTYPYASTDIEAFRLAALQIAKVIDSADDNSIWIPPLHQIEKWWDRHALFALGRIVHEIRSQVGTRSESVVSLLKVAFCRTMIECANVSFGHQSMSFKERSSTDQALPGLFSSVNWVADSWARAVGSIARGAETPIVIQTRPLFCDARELSHSLPSNHYSSVITSPPYPNRMSYIRELRPYMYWLGYLSDGHQAGEMDWQAIGGTWGCATSNLSRWEPEFPLQIPWSDFPALIERIAANSKLLSRYVAKYFFDMARHVKEVVPLLRANGELHYIIGNSKFYDVLVPTEKIFAAMFEDAGLCDVTVSTIRKRTSKRELFEYRVSARKPT